MRRMHWYQAGCFSLAWALAIAITFLFDLTPEEPGYWVVVYAESLVVLLLAVAVSQRVEEGRIDWIGIAHAVLTLGRYSVAVLIVAVPVFILRTLFPLSWLDTLNAALTRGFALNIVVILVLVTVLAWIEKRRFVDVLMNVRRDDQQ